MDKIILAVGDLHLPYHSHNTIDKIYCIAHDLYQNNVVNGDYNGLYICQVGDLLDAFSFSRFSSKIVSTPQKEIEEGRFQADIFWSSMKLAAPNAECYQLKGNHDARIIKRLIDKAPELEMFFCDKWLYEFDGVNTIHDPREVLFIENIACIHGWMSRAGSHAKHFMCDTITGHTHRGGVVSFNDIRRSGRPISELNCGYAGNPLSVPFSYPATKFTHWTLGVGIWDRLGPRFVHL